MHSWLLGERIYIPTTAVAGCILGVDIVESAETCPLVEGYKSFRAEAIALNPDYRPQTVNTDGWDHTQAAWQTLFPGIEIVLCSLHVVLDKQKRCRRTKTLFQKLMGVLWHVYKAATKRQFAQRLRRLQDWAAAFVEPKMVRRKLLKLADQGSQISGRL